ncbi:MAG: UbiA family prenyltransferase, partial [Planctomycetota bacterium]
MSGESQPRWLAWGQVLRLSLAPSAAADAAAGVLLGAGGWPLSGLSALPMVASLAVYHGGMGLNDWADREQDARARPGRPIPSGRVSATTVLVAAVALLLLGPL